MLHYQYARKKFHNDFWANRKKPDSDGWLAVYVSDRSSRQALVRNGEGKLFTAEARRSLKRNGGIEIWGLGSRRRGNDTGWFIFGFS